MSSGPFAHVIVLGNEKGGSGKSTVAVHLAIGLMQLGFAVTIADFDVRQRSLQHYIENRRSNIAENWLDLPCPGVYTPPAEAADPHCGQKVLDEISHDFELLRRRTEFLIIDTPGSVTAASCLVHSFADTLITPMNDSLIDLDVLARLAPGNSRQILGPSQYSLLVLEQRRRRLKEHGLGLDWIVLRNRITQLASSNNRKMGQTLDTLAPQLGFRVAPGFSERVIYRELFLTGATVLDPLDEASGIHPSSSHMAAREEVRELFEALWLPNVTRRARA